MPNSNRDAYSCWEVTSPVDRQLPSPLEKMGISSATSGDVALPTVTESASNFGEVGLNFAAPDVLSTPDLFAPNSDSNLLGLEPPFGFPDNLVSKNLLSNTLSDRTTAMFLSVPQAPSEHLPASNIRAAALPASSRSRPRRQSALPCQCGCFSNCARCCRHPSLFAWG